MSRPIASSTRAALIVGVYVVGLAGMVDLSNRSLSVAERLDVQNLLVYLPWATVGAVLAIRRPSNPIGLLLMAFALTFLLSSDPPGTTSAELVAGSYSWLVGLRLIVANGAGLAAYTTLFLLVVLFPDGDLPRGRRRWAVVVTAASGYALAVMAMLGPTVHYGDPQRGGVLIPAPLPFPAVGAPAAALIDGGQPLGVIIVALGAAVGSLVVRWRRATGVRRQQFAWVVASFVVLALAVAVALGTIFLGALLSVNVPESIWFPLLFIFPLPPIAIGIAVLRYRLFDIDRIVSRTIGYGLATAGVVMAFAVLTVALQQALTPFLQGHALAVAASTLVVFSLFQPIHRRTQRVVDRRFDRARYDADRAATAFARGVRDETDLVQLEDALVRTVDATLSPASRTVWVRERLHRAIS